MVINLRPYQEETLAKMGNGKIMWGGTGAGKSITAVVYYMRNEAPKPIYVITTARKRDSLDWEGEFAKAGVSTTHSVAGTLTVDSWNNIDKYKGITDAFFIFDEQRVVGSGAWVKAFEKIAKSNRWIMLSATPGDTWLDYIPVFVANGFYKNRTEFKREHVVYTHYGKFPKVDRYLSVGKLLRHKNSVLVHMPYVPHTTRHLYDLGVGYDQEKLDQVRKKRWHVYENRPLRDVAELFGVARKVVNADDTRLAMVRQLMSFHPKLIVFYNFDYELEMLRSLNHLTSTQQNTTHGSSDTMTCPKNCPLGCEKTNLNGISIETSPSISPTHSITSLVSEPQTDECGRWRTSSFSIPKTSPAQSTNLEESGLSGSTSVEVMRPIKGDSMGSSVQTVELRETDPWEYLTSKEGLKENESLMRSEADDSWSISTRSGKSSSSLTLSSMPGSPKMNSEGLESGPIPAATALSTNIPVTQSDVVIAEWNGHKHEPIPKTDSWVYLVQYAAGAEAWNCIETDAMVFYSLTYSYKLYHQSMGRIDRMNTPFQDLHYYVLKSNSFIDKLIWKALKAKKSFNEGPYKAVFGF